MGPKKPPKAQRGDAHLHGVQKGRPKKKANGRPAGAKNKIQERQYTDEELQFAVNMDIDRLKNPGNHQYSSRREMCDALKISESTIRLQLKKIKEKLPILNKALGLTGQRLLTNAEESILVNVILDGQEQGVCITKTNILHMVSDFITFEKEIQVGRLVEDDATLAARLTNVDNLHANSTTLARHYKWYQGFKRRHPKIKPKKPQYLGRKRGKVTEAQVRGWFSDRIHYFKLKHLMDVIEDPENMFNFDETNVTFSPQIPYVLTVSGLKSTKHAFVQTSGQTEKGSVTAVVMASASGKFPPPPC